MTVSLGQDFANQSAIQRLNSVSLHGSDGNTALRMLSHAKSNVHDSQSIAVSVIDSSEP